MTRKGVLLWQCKELFHRVRVALFLSSDFTVFLRANLPFREHLGAFISRFVIFLNFCDGADSQFRYSSRTDVNLRLKIALQGSVDFAIITYYTSVEQTNMEQQLRPRWIFSSVKAYELLYPFLCKLVCPLIL